MKYLFRILFSTLLIFIQIINAQTNSQHRVAITIDDLPVVTLQKDFNTHKIITGRLLSALNENKINATGFVIGNKLYKNETLDTNEVNLLKLWLNDGMELGNHSYSHKSLNNTDIDVFKEDVIKCDKIIKKILAAYNKKPVFYRQPYLQFGKNKDKIDEFYKFLQENSYKMAPVTIDNSDWIFARAYENSYLKEDSVMMGKIAGAYIPYMKSKFEYYKNQSEKLFGYEIKQILLIHASRLNADHIGELIKMIQGSGYKIISLTEALTDKAYNHEDNFLGNAGISWLHRWALTEGKEKVFFKGEPLTPGFVMDVAGIHEE